MSPRILPPTEPTTQELARAAVDRHYITQIAELLLQRDRRDNRVRLADVDAPIRAAYLDDATLVVINREVPKPAAAMGRA